jgi:hypothetical protein
VTDPLAPLFAADPAGPSLEMRFRQGTIVSFNQLTWQNTVSVGGTVMTDLPLYGVGETALLVPGAVVGIVVVGDATKSMYITGRIVKPNTADAFTVMGLLNSQIYTDYVTSAAGDVCSSTTYVDLANIGPRVTVPVGNAGRILVIASAQIQWATGFAATSIGDGRFDVEFAGANTRTPTEASDPLVGVASISTFTAAGTNANVGLFSVTTQALFTGLNSGDTVITMKYRKSATATIDTNFFRRTLTVFKL